MDQVLLFARELARTEQRFRYIKPERKRQTYSPHLDDRLRRTVKAYGGLLSKAERELLVMQIECSKREIKSFVKNAFEDDGRLKSRDFNLRFYPVALVAEFKNGYSARDFLGEDSYGMARIIDDPYLIAVVFIGMRRNILYHEYAHVFNSYRLAFFGEISDSMDELSAYVLSSPSARLRLFDQTRLVELVHTKGLEKLEHIFSINAGPAMIGETLSADLIRKIRSMLGPVLDEDAIAVSRLLDSSQPDEKAVFKLLISQHPFMHLDGRRELIFLTSSVISVTNGDFDYSYYQLRECLSIQ
ncbi:MAG: hypothetical protein ABID61_05365 [Candidatus Micrarchaeota archaeon]